MVGPPYGENPCGGLFLSAHGFCRSQEGEEPMSGDLILVIVVVLVFLGGMGGLLIYANTGKEKGDEKKDEEKR
jgi:hypothetical protein